MKKMGQHALVEEKSQAYVDQISKLQSQIDSMRNEKLKLLKIQKDTENANSKAIERAELEFSKKLKEKSDQIKLMVQRSKDVITKKDEYISELQLEIDDLTSKLKETNAVIQHHHQQFEDEDDDSDEEFLNA
mmetsp:Transcript_2635/g.3788  ORF Transcript_2635/g.3788 Transcript_2635/m.3788 type:complete len:132 (-) Transcript_2635:12-407(-)